MAKNIFEIVTAKEIAAYYNETVSNRIPYLGETLFPNKKQLGLDLSWIKGSNGLPVVLKPSAFDTKVTLRDRMGFEKLETEMPFFKEGMLIKEKDRQELNKLLATGNQTYIDAIVNRIFDDQVNLINAATAQTERIRMQIMTTGLLNISANGVAMSYDYQMPGSHKVTASVAWTQTDDSNPIDDIQTWIDLIENDKGVTVTRAVCNRTTWRALLKNKAIRLDMNPLGGQNVIMTDNMMREYLSNKLGVTVQVYNKKFKDETGAEKNYIDDGVFLMIPDGNLGNTYFGTTPEESDLMASSVANVAVVNTGIAVTTTKTTDPVNVETKASMITLPSFERIDEIVVADVI